jgi:dTDP-glucose 4,6-dehydratase
MVDFHSSRPGHDLRYALDGSKMDRMGWRPKETIAQSVHNVTRWSLDNYRWLRAA